MFAVPDLTVPEMGGGARRSLPPATLMRAVAADPAIWRHLIRYEPDAPTRVRLGVEYSDLEFWLRGWLPGQSASLVPPEAMFTVVLGAITEVGSADGRVVRDGQTRILGRDYRKRLVNRGESAAVTLHAVVPLTG